MRKIVLSFVLAVYCGLVSAQWAVLDEKVRIIVEEIKTTSGGKTDLDAFSYEKHEMNAKFEQVSNAKAADYIGTAADCGDPTMNPNHYNACLGLRNLRLKTLEQTQSIVKTIQDRGAKIKKLVSDGASLLKAGELQKQQFALMGLQAEMQNDAMELEAVRYGYKQREKIYEMQMAEARRNSDTRVAPGAGGVSIKIPVPFAPK